jgi:hypothetical protein
MVILSILQLVKVGRYVPYRAAAKKTSPTRSNLNNFYDKLPPKEYEKRNKKR